MTWSSIHGRIHWKPGDDYRNDTILRLEEENETSCVRSFLREGAISCNPKRASSDVSPTCRVYQKKLKRKLDDEIKLAGLEARVPEVLEKHLIFNSNRLRKSKEARLEIVTYVEAKFALRIRDAGPGEAASRAQSDPMDVGAVNSVAFGKRNASAVPRGGCFTCGGVHYRRDGNARKGKSKQSSGKGKQNGKSWSTVRADEKAKKTRKNRRKIEECQGCKTFQQG